MSDYTCWNPPDKKKTCKDYILAIKLSRIEPFTPGQELEFDGSVINEQLYPVQNVIITLYDENYPHNILTTAKTNLVLDNERFSGTFTMKFIPENVPHYNLVLKIISASNRKLCEPTILNKRISRL